ncbi:MAG: TIGR03087 family PEP-CTERM/XrtA system glycosyltransferase [Gammaproteobacteria bacterium]|nr:TIGR03087 family PEP-CTERM/XrtA system glycosyltransferase [Gammaproteobacteria bacterium]
MKNLLYLVHRLPYPPNKGDKITSFNLLKYLSRHYNVYLGCFVDEPKDWQYLSRLEPFCSGFMPVRLDPRTAKARSLSGFLKGEALSLPYYRNSRLQNWVDGILESKHIDNILVLSGAMAQYVSPHLSNRRSLLDLEDVDSDKWQLYAKDHTWPLNWIFQRESRKLLAYEQAMASKFDVTLFVSRMEAQLFQNLCPEVAHKVRYRVQGVDFNYFDPSRTYPNPYDRDTRVLVFTGAMDYWPNADAVIWFARDVLPKIRKTVPNVQFWIVGMNPLPRVQALSNDPSVIVTGFVSDVRPYLAHAVGAVLPLRVARGIQNKILEAMAMEKPVLATTDAIHGIEVSQGFSPLVSDSPEGLAKLAIALLTCDDPKPSATRALVQQKYDWEANLNMLHQLFEEDSPKNCNAIDSDK